MFFQASFRCADLVDVRASQLRDWAGSCGEGPLDTLAFQLDCKLGQPTFRLEMTSKLQSACSTLTKTGSVSGPVGGALSWRSEGQICFLAFSSF